MMRDKLVGYEKTRPPEITSPFCKYAKRNDENKEIKVWGQQRKLILYFSVYEKGKSASKIEEHPTGTCS
jgi:hypothetical protein